MTEREAKYLGAFLHDIGKFHYRAENIRESHEDLGKTLLKTMEGFAVFGSKSEFQQFMSGYIGTSGKMKSADIETAKSEREPDEKHPGKTRRPLMSVFSRVDIGRYFEEPENGARNYGDYVKSGVYAIKPEPLEFAVQMPKFDEGVDLRDWKLNDKEQQDMIANHKEPFGKLRSELQRLDQISDFRAFFTTLYKLCEKYTSSVCSAGYASVPDITLFDHSRVVGALSVCLDEGGKGEGDKGIDDKAKECLLIYGDISGIQKFIYQDIKMADHPAKKLRGRSFYIRLAAEAVSNYLMRQFEVYDCNVLMCSGGHFLLLVPNNSNNRAKLEVLERKVSQWFIDEFSGDLMLLISSMQCSVGELMNFYETFRKLSSEMAKVKRKKSFSILKEAMGGGLNRKDKGKLFQTIGERLPKSKYLIEIITNDRINQGNDFISFQEFGISYKLSNDNYPVREIDSLSGIQYAIVHNIENTNAFGDVNYDYKKGYSIGYSFKFTGSHLPKNQSDDPLSFEELAVLDLEKEKFDIVKEKAKSEKKKKNYSLLGIARMDVDSLGRIFSRGLLRDEKESSGLYSISRIVNMSRELDHFFSGYVPLIAKGHQVYLTYAGGDDLFAVGSWINILHFVKQVRERFKEFVCKNPNISISCGIVFVPANYPISRSAELAGEQEGKAKDSGIIHINGTEINVKDRISVFFRQIKWKTLYDMMDVGERLLKILSSDGLDKKEKLARSFIHNLLSITQKCFNKDGSLNPEAVSKAMGRIHYAFARRDVNAEEIEKHKLGYKTDFAKRFIESDEEDRKNWFYNFVIPASYVLLKTRETEN